MASTPNSGDRPIQTAVSATSLTPIEVIGAVVLTATLAAGDGVWGLLVGLLVFGAARVSTGPAAFVVAQLGIISLGPISEAWLLVTAQGAAFLLLASVAYGRFPDSRRLGRLAVVYIVSLGGVWVLQANVQWLWHSALTFVVLATTGAYALHRYERVTAGLVTAEREQ